MAIKNVLVSVFKKQGVPDFVSTLVKEFNVHVLSTGGTAKLLKASGIQVQDVSEFTGAPELFDGRVKTLHPRIEGGILFRRDNPKDVQEARTHDIVGIDMVVCNLYPFQDTIQDPNVPLDDAIEMIDVGGPTMIRAAAKNFKDVTVVSRDEHFPLVLNEMRENHGSTTLDTRMKLAVDVFRQTSTYDAAIFKFLEKKTGQGTKFPDVLVKIFKKVHSCRYGENWDQDASFYADTESPFGIHSLNKLWGKEISYNNYLDIDACFQILSDLNDHEHVCAIFKHMNPNGIAVDSKTQMDACKHAFNCDPLSAFGGIWGFNKPLEPAVADYLINERKVFIEVLLAPSIPAESRAIMEKKENMRVLEFGDMLSKRDVLYQNMEIRGLLGGLLLEDYDSKPVVKEWNLMSNRPVSDDEKKTLV
nr:bifunctional phosphoribosylaminoimidazolecarboxamide formyltransferase/IMP cyclohydrolase [Candidatus Sigynarchaeota archaeon]